MKSWEQRMLTKYCHTLLRLCFNAHNDIPSSFVGCRSFLYKKTLRTCNFPFTDVTFWNRKFFTLLTGVHLRTTIHYATVRLRAWYAPVQTALYCTYGIFSKEDSTMAHGMLNAYFPTTLCQFWQNFSVESEHLIYALVFHETIFIYSILIFMVCSAFMVVIDLLVRNMLSQNLKHRLIFICDKLSKIRK